MRNGGGITRNKGVAAKKFAEWRWHRKVSDYVGNDENKQQIPHQN